MRVILLEWILPTNNRDSFDYDVESPLDAFRRGHGQWLVEGQATPFDYIHTLLNYGMKKAKSAYGKDHITFSNDNQILSYDGDPSEICMWKACVHKLVEELEQLTGLLLHVSELPTVDFYSPELRDNHNMKNIGKDLGTEQSGGKEGRGRGC
jgi:hypothetical protein